MMLTKRYLILAGWWRRLITTQKISEIESNVPIVTRLVTTAALNAKATKIESEISDITNLTSKAAGNTKAKVIENQIRDIINPATKTALNTRATEIENKISDTTSFIITPESNKKVLIQ